MMKQVLYGVIMFLLATGCGFNVKENKVSENTTEKENKKLSVKSPFRVVKGKGISVPVYDFKGFGQDILRRFHMTNLGSTMVTE